MRMTEDPALQALSSLSKRYLDLSLDTANQLLWEGESPWGNLPRTIFQMPGDLHENWVMNEILIAKKSLRDVPAVACHCSLCKP